MKTSRFAVKKIFNCKNAQMLNLIAVQQLAGLTIESRVAVASIRRRFKCDYIKMA